MILPLKQQSTKLINGWSQTNWDQKSNLLLLQRHYQSQKIRVKLVKKLTKYITKYPIYYTGYITI